MLQPPPGSPTLALLRQFFIFGLVGTAAFLVDVAVLYALREFLGLFVARIVSFLVATLFTWSVNRTLTFANGRSRLSPHAEFLRYLLFVLGGGGVNLLTYTWLVTSVALVASHPFLGVAAGSITGMLVNFSLLKWILYRH